MGLLMPGIQCLDCKHLGGVVETSPMVDGVEGDCGYACAAFPEGIPDEIAEDILDHRHHGIRWEPRELGIKHPKDDGRPPINRREITRSGGKHGHGRLGRR